MSPSFAPLSPYYHPNHKYVDGNVSHGYSTGCLEKLGFSFKIKAWRRVLPEAYNQYSEDKILSIPQSFGR
jgi:hypothetical protein